MSPADGGRGIVEVVRELDVAECYEKHSDALVRYAATLVGPADADDVVAAAVLGVLRSSTESVDDLRGYLYRAVTNAGRRHWRSLDRRARRERLVAGSSVVTASEPDTDVRDALLTLSTQQRALIHLTYWEDLTPAMAAARLGVSDGTVRRQLARARRKLAEELR